MKITPAMKTALVTMRAANAQLVSFKRTPQYNAHAFVKTPDRTFVAPATVTRLYYAGLIEPVFDKDLPHLTATAFVLSVAGRDAIKEII